MRDAALAAALVVADFFLGRVEAHVPKFLESREGKLVVIFKIPCVEFFACMNVNEIGDFHLMLHGKEFHEFEGLK